MSQSKTKVYPVPGFYLADWPTTEHEVDERTAKRLIATGAFSLTKPKAPPQPEESPDGGSSDSEE